MRSNRPKQLSLLKTLETSLPKAKFQLSKEQAEQLNNVTEVLLGVAAVAGVATVAIIAPNALQLINKAKWVKKTFKNHSTKREDQKNKIARAFYHLQKERCIELIPQGETFIVKITEKGKRRVSEMSLRTLKINNKQKWSGTWWLMLADIPVEFRNQINLFRKKIKEIGLYTLQKSVWIYPYDFRDEMDFLAKYYGLEKFITTLEVKSLEGSDERRLKYYYKKLKII